MEAHASIFCSDYLTKGLINLESSFFPASERNDPECEGSRNSFNEDFICVTRKGRSSLSFSKNHIRKLTKVPAESEENDVMQIEMWEDAKPDKARDIDVVSLLRKETFPIHRLKTVVPSSGHETKELIHGSGHCPIHRPKTVKRSPYEIAVDYSYLNPLLEIRIYCQQSSPIHHLKMVASLDLSELMAPILGSQCPIHHPKTVQ